MAAIAVLALPWMALETLSTPLSSCEPAPPPVFMSEGDARPIFISVADLPPGLQDWSPGEFPRWPDDTAFIPVSVASTSCTARSTTTSAAPMALLWHDADVPPPGYANQVVIPASVDLLVVPALAVALALLASRAQRLYGESWNAIGRFFARPHWARTAVTAVAAMSLTSQVVLAVAPDFRDDVLTPINIATAPLWAFHNGATAWIGHALSAIVAGWDVSPQPAWATSDELSAPWPFGPWTKSVPDGMPAGPVLIADALLIGFWYLASAPLVAMARRVVRRPESVNPVAHHEGPRPMPNGVVGTLVFGAALVAAVVLVPLHWWRDHTQLVVLAVLVLAVGVTAGLAATLRPHRALTWAAIAALPPVGVVAWLTLGKTDTLAWAILWSAAVAGAAVLGAWNGRRLGRIALPA